MEMAGTALAFFGLGATALATSLVALKRRLRLSKAKYASLDGHARVARRIASFVPFYEYDENRFFCSDQAPAEIAWAGAGPVSHGDRGQRQAFDRDFRT
jgi:glutamate-1-semialdehyde 2,1-aminomutase